MVPSFFLSKSDIAIVDNIPISTDAPCYFCDSIYDTPPIPIPIEEVQHGPYNFTYFCLERALCCSFNCAKAYRSNYKNGGRVLRYESTNIVFRMAYRLARLHNCQHMRKALLTQGIAQSNDRHCLQRYNGTMSQQEYTANFFYFPNQETDETLYKHRTTTIDLPVCEAVPNYKVTLHGVQYVESWETMYDRRTGTMVSDPKTAGCSDTAFSETVGRKVTPSKRPYSRDTTEIRQKTKKRRKRTKAEIATAERVNSARQRSGNRLTDKQMEPRKREANAWSAHRRTTRRATFAPSTAKIVRQADAMRRKEGVHPEQIAAQAIPVCSIERYFTENTSIPTLGEAIAQKEEEDGPRRSKRTR